MSPSMLYWSSLVVSPVVLVSIMAVAVWIAWQNRDRHPKTVRLFLIAVLLSILNVVLRFLESSNIVLFMPLIKTVGKTSMPDLSQLSTWTFLTWQATKCSLSIISWSLMAWAILMRPNDPVSQS